ncbi:hypothetical protein PR202_gb29247 [Eleusine coracana subsp. coracana]|uniref:Uncharacterized protein n=1 Tax=Eleusine coracana subsp. coracana TaxID=191504 RepID=A0AAV5FWK4_ELECO|nr:hypothetical protein PR202_gb29247 [Eleusine coracana subsp. coracana]
MATRLAAVAFYRISRRLFRSSSVAAASRPTLLGHFHQPGSVTCLADLHVAPRPPPHAPARRDEIHLAVCDPVSRRHALLPQSPPSFVAGASKIFITALISRANSSPFDFDAVCFTVLAGRLRD